MRLLSVFVLAAVALLALPSPSRAADEDRSEIKTTFDAGLAAYDRGDFPAAAIDFERVLALDPMHHRARLELARTYYAQGRFEESRKQFETVLSYNPPETVQKNIQLFLDRIDRENRRFNLSLRVSAGVLYDDNVNIGPDSDLIHIRPTSFAGVTLDTLTVSSDSQPQSSWGEFAEGTVYGQYDAGNKGDWLVAGGADYYQTWLQDHSDREIFYGDVFAGPALVRKASLLSLPLRAAHIDQGSDSLVNIYGAAPSYTVAHREDLLFTTALTAEYRDYSDLDDRDSYYTELREEVTHLYDNKNKAVTGGLGIFREDADSDVNSNYGLQASVGSSIDLPWKSRFEVKGGYRGSWYDEREPLMVDDRMDNEFQGLAQLTKQIGKDWSVGLLYQYTKRDSNFDLYDYDRNFVNVHVNFAL